MNKGSNKPSGRSITSSANKQTADSNPTAQIGSAVKSLANGHLGSSAKTVSPTLLNIATGMVFAIPAAAGTAVGGMAAAFYGTMNMIKCRKNKKSKKQATKDTVIRSTGMGVSAGLGVAAGGVVAEAVTGIVIAETAVAVGTIAVPVVVGIAVSYGSMKLWNKLFKKSHHPETKSKANHNQKNEAK
ncbi:hypothetical protein ACFL3G_00430 [Planctomycetota bacterium]